eukprot:COSAG02_NODE_405_length_23022_cov_14.617764_2_plen_269_part_00
MLGGLLTSLNEFSEAWSSYLDGEVQAPAGAEEEGARGSERGDVDQIVAFFEREYDGHEEHFGRFLGTAEDAKAFESQRTVYFNLTTCIDHQNEQIFHLLEELQAKRAEFRQLLLDAPSTQRLGRLTAAAVMEVQSMPATKVLLTSIEVLKMDITDRKNTRYFKERERQEAAGPLSKLISGIKLRKFERASMLGDAGDGDTGSPAPEHFGARDIGIAKKDEESGEQGGGQDRDDGAVTLGGAFVSSGSVRRRKRPTDDEINAALREKLF